MKIAGAQVHWSDGFTLSTLAEGRVMAEPEDNDTYRARAQSLGYGSNTALMSREHELTHHLLAKWLGLGRSPTMVGIASKDFFKDWQVEEAAVIAIQAFARLMSVDLVQLARSNADAQ